MMNLFTYVTTHPWDLDTKNEPSEQNNLRLKETSQKCSMVVFAWGSFDKYTRSRDKEVMAMFPGAYCFGQTKGGNPRHPLYLKSALEPTPFLYGR
jgi:hypothetical protein